ncbi:MAG: ABC-F family ATP-binding cassette domain-containing protein [Acidobacteria bacterium]|nr:ABC-F family ATP-binding cassette domain-containing protein [Acidobacteriota bacterium]MBV9474938.1 ABC-F family ATP-binding cassette domain-containing protein [Acidobacteriota bacterium]
MPPVLLSADGLTKAYGARPLFENLSFTLFEGDHVGLVGPNGSGKSTLLKILAGAEDADSGTRALRKGVRVGYVPQDPVFAPGRSAEDVLLDALSSDTSLDEHEKFARVALALGRAGFTDRAIRTETLSGGWRKRLAIARELVREPDVLLLDEPTNHLDVDAILWLESLLGSDPKAFVVVSHDRYFLENVTKRMLELNRAYAGGLLAVDGTYSDLLEKRDEVLRNEAAYQETLANLVRREMEWLRRGAKARTTKAKARIQNAEKLIDELAEGRDRAQSFNTEIDFTASQRKTKRLWSARGLTKTMGDQPIVRNLDLLLTPGARLGILGPNGSGKTTLLRMIVGTLAPDAGSIERADGLRVVYFEQNRESLDPNVTLKRALAPEGDSVIYRDRPIHVAGWAKRFLFRSEQLETAVSRLSGGEKARIVLARLMLQPADLLVMDEPTNDLDIPTLDVLEESLLDFPGALVLVTHDRYLLDRVSTRLLALDGRGNAEFFADFPQWEAAQRDTPAASLTPSTAAPKPSAPKTKRLSYLEQREFDAMEETVLAAEARVEEAQRRAEDPSIAADAGALQTRYAELQAAHAEVERLYARWAELEAKLV